MVPKSSHVGHESEALRKIESVSELRKEVRDHLLQDECVALVSDGAEQRSLLLLVLMLFVITGISMGGSGVRQRCNVVVQIE